MESEASRILVIGGTGYIGKYIVKASVLLGHPTYIYSRKLTPQTYSSKRDLLYQFQSMGVTIVHGEIEEQEKLVGLLRQVDVVICTLAYPQVLEQLKIIDAIKIAGNIMRFFPSDFGCEEDRVNPLKPFQEFLDKKRRVRRATEAAGIPYTFVSANCFGSYFVNYLLRPHETRDDVFVYGTGQVKAVFNYEEDIAIYTIKAATDPRTCNRIITYRPQANIVSQLELISIWEKKTGRSFNRVYVLEEELIKLSEILPDPENIPVSIIHSLFVKGELMSFELGEDDLEASELYPDFKYTSIDQLLDIFLVDPPQPATAAFE
ncbi:Hopanoid-associated sugar epimerase [Trema orientale]|uniref:Hopanoid-associated sugar epimerase n=1 Tax=Trema orientale TaxID=63057 RepID=A0A2P5FQZ7_TREOI|nr:Hopanoid-associated sugar epimerase [Trema orientale]